MSIHHVTLVGDEGLNNSLIYDAEGYEFTIVDVSLITR